MPSYVRPPIVEAFLELRFAPEISPSQIEKCVKKVSKIYPISNPEFAAPAIEFSISKDGNIKSRIPDKAVKRSYRLETVNAENILSLQPNVIWFGRNAPYPGWSEFFGYFEKCWPLFSTIIGRKDIQRIGCRYVNRLDIPLEKEGQDLDLMDYINIGVGSPLDLKIEGFHTSLGVYLSKEHKATLRISSGVPVVPKTAALFMDIDIFVTNSGFLSDEDLFKALGKMQTVKNNFFESLITNKARSIFNRSI